MNLSDKLGIVLFIISVALLIIVLANINQYVWDDEVFTLNLISQSYLQFINGTAMDVHPPLYYLLYQFVSDITSSFLFFLNISFNQIVVAKLFSITPIVLLLIFNFIVSRKKLADYSLVYLLCV